MTELILTPDELRARLSVVPSEFQKVIDEAEATGRKIIYYVKETPFGNFPIAAEVKPRIPTYTICVAPKMIVVNGHFVASTLSGFKNWIIKNKVSVAEFKNWPFVVGISSDLETRKVKFWID